MKAQPLVCICIPTYNNEKTISETLDSIINQTYKNIMVKIFDNASTDNSIKILKEYQSRFDTIHVYQNEENIGGEANFTKCIENMEGQYGAIYHSDDVYMPTIIEEEVRALEENDISVVFTNKRLIGMDSCLLEQKNYFPDELLNKEFHQFNFYQIFNLILKYSNFLTTPSAMAKVDLYKNKIKEWDVGKFNTSSDLDVWLRFSEIKDIGIITKELIHYRVASSSFSYRRKFKNIETADYLKVFEFYLKKYNNFNADYYQFYKFRDTCMIVRNKIINNLHVKSSDIELFNISLLKIILKDNDKDKYKLYLFGLIYKILLLLGMKSFLLRLLKKRHGL